MKNNSNSIADLFIKEAIKTESVNFVEIAKRLSEKRTIRLLHAAIGLSTEANEFLDALKKFIFYGKELDLVNIAEELGDGDWYKAIALDELGRTQEEIWTMVIKKLQKRYKGNFNQEGAINRNLDEERRTIEDNLNEITESVVDRIKMEIIDVHWLVIGEGEDKDTALCGLMIAGDKFTLDRSLLTCDTCIRTLEMTKGLDEPR